jgi:transglutaminase-like putative cysteine protease
MAQTRSNHRNPGLMTAQPSSTTALRCDLEYRIDTPSHFMMHIQAAQCPDQQIVQEYLQITPPLQTLESWDAGTGNRIFRFDFGPGRLRIRYDARVNILRFPIDSTLPEVDVNQVPDAVVPYLMPSRFCESDSLSVDAQQLFGHWNRGFQRVAGICQWIRDNIEYRIGTSGATTSAVDTFRDRTGVCRDFAHLLIAFCRALNIPARLVVGYVHFSEPPQDFHAVTEVWLGGRWVMFDATALAPVEELVRVGSGRDAKDLAFATIYGSMRMTHMHIQVNPDGRPVSDKPNPVEATVRQEY